MRAHHRTEHRAVVIDQGQDHRPFPEVLLELHSATRLIEKLEIQRYLLAEPLSRSRLLDRIQLPFSGIALTNVPGPPRTLYLDGARMITLLGGTFLLDRLGLIIAVTSYEDRLIITFTSTPEAVPDPELLAACFRESFDALERAAATTP